MFNIESLREQMRAYYEPLKCGRVCRRGGDDYNRRRHEIWGQLDDFFKDRRDASADFMKSEVQARIVESFEPQIFPHSPFFFEMGVRYSESWGTPSWENFASWLKNRRDSLIHDNESWRKVCSFGNGSPWKIWAPNDVFDADHHCLNYSKLLSVGVAGIIEEIRERRKSPSLSKSQLDFLDAAERGNSLLVKAANKFADKAELLLKTESDAKARKFLAMIASAARQVPEKPPRSFYEGLAALLFLREGVGSLENIGISVLGHADRLLGGLLKHDLLEGVLTRDEAKDLIARWCLHTDVKFHVDDNVWPETSTCLELGGCDADGKAVFNEVTKLFIETHVEGKFINPKLNCRYSKSSPEEYLKLVGDCVSAGHNNFAFLNDDALIPACVKSGKTLREARLYVNGGCQETIVEGVEHSAGAYYYFNMARTFDLYLHPLQEVKLEGLAAETIGCLERKPETFEDFYKGFMKSLAKTIGAGAQWLREASEKWPEAHPCPLFSSAMEGCLEKAADYTRGSMKYNTAAVALVGFGTVADSLAAIKKAVYDEKFVNFDELVAALNSNWEGREDLRLKMAAAPKFGHGSDEADALAARLAQDVADSIKPLKNERGGNFQPSFFVYYTFVGMGAVTRATPDGRKNGGLLSQGVAPGRVRPSESLTNAVRAMEAIDFTEFPGNAVLDIQTPCDKKGGARMAAILKSFAQAGGMTVQPNCVSVATLQDAQKNPDAHRDLIVRISGLSAKFVGLSPQVQNEIITRTMY